MKLLSEDELTTKQALHLIDLQLKEQVSFQDLHELYMLDYTTAIPSPHLKTCQLLVGLNTATRLVQILKGTSGSGINQPTNQSVNQLCVLGANRLSNHTVNTVNTQSNLNSLWCSQ